MKMDWGKITVLSMLSLLAMACSGTKDSAAVVAPAISPTPTPTYTCAYESMFDTLDSCQTATLANCSSQYVTFPNGGIAQCFGPATGWQSCLLSPATWTYSVYQACADSGSGLYYGSRSVIGCSSTTCACLDTQVTKSPASCALGSGDCATPTPPPSGTPYPVPYCP